MSNITSIVTSNENISATVDSTGSSTTVSQVGIQGISGGVIPLSQNSEVDTTTNGKLNGSVLVYKTITNKWTATTTLDAQNMEGGHY